MEGDARAAERLLEVLSGTLHQLPGLRAVVASRDEGVDLWIHGGESPVALQLKVLERGYPRDIRAVAESLQDRQGREDNETITLLGTPSLAPGSRKMLQAMGVGYWDGGGSLYLRLPWGLYLVDRPAPRVVERRGRELFRGASSRVLHTLLREPERLWAGTELASAAGVSKATVSRVLDLLEKNLWGGGEGSGSRRAGFRLHQPGELLEAWSRVHSLEDYRLYRFHAPAPSGARLEQAAKELLKASGVDYALTLESGASRRAPFSTVSRYVAALVSSGPDWSSLAGATDFRPVDKGENLLLLEVSDTAPLMYREELDGVWVASPIQLYLDLHAWPRRGREQAAHLREVCLGY